MTNYLYQARVFPIGKPASIGGDRGQPVTFTFDKHDFSVSRRLANDIPVWLNHDPGSEDREPPLSDTEP